MNLFVAKTDLNWFADHYQHQRDEVNFWRPSGQLLGALKPGEPLLFLLKSPVNAIAGFGRFSIAYQMPVSKAWQYFGNGNGVSEEQQFLAKIKNYRSVAKQERDPIIGCIVLNECVWFDEADYVRMPADFASNIVTGKTYYAYEGEGLRVWQDVQAIAGREKQDQIFHPNMLAEPTSLPYGYAERKIRYGQGAFRTIVEANYERCAISGEKTRPVLEAAHIQPYSVSQDHSPTNGLLLRSDVHKLYDLGYITVTPDYEVQVSGKLREDFSNGKIYYRHDGQQLAKLPKSKLFWPDTEKLAWHKEKIWLG